MKRPSNRKDSTGRKNPLIGITCHVDTGGQEDIFPGRALNYIDRTYPDALIANGMTPMLIPVNEDVHYLHSVIERLDGLLLAGGGKIPDSILDQPEIPGLAETAPSRYRFEKALFTAALEADLPVLGMCRGMQMFNEVMGGTLHSKIAEKVPGAMEHNQVKLSMSLEQPYHDIAIEPDSHLSRLIGTAAIAVNSWHSQALDKIGAGLRVVARSGDTVIEAVESQENTFVCLMQFHPEILVKAQPVWNRLFQGFRTQALGYKTQKENQS